MYCKKVNCEHLYYVYGCEAACDLKENKGQECDKEKQINDIKMENFYQTPYGKLCKELSDVKLELNRYKLIYGDLPEGVK